MCQLISPFLSLQLEIDPSLVLECGYSGDSVRSGQFLSIWFLFLQLTSVLEFCVSIVDVPVNLWSVFQECLKTCMRLVKEGVSVLFFPEGTRTIDGALASFKVSNFLVNIMCFPGSIPWSLALSVRLFRLLGVSNHHGEWLYFHFLCKWFKVPNWSISFAWIPFFRLT